MKKLIKNLQLTSGVLAPEAQKPINKGGRPKGSGVIRNDGVSDVDVLNSRLRYAVRRNFKPMYEAQIAKAKAGHFPPFQYLLDRVLGKPVEQIKMAAQIRLILDE